MNRYLLPALGLALASSVATPAVSAPKKTATAATAQRARAARQLCKQVRAKPVMRKRTKAALRGGELKRANVGKVTGDVCKFYSASSAQQRVVWNKALNTLVSAGQLTAKDKRALADLPFKAEVLQAWTPSTAFGQTLQDSESSNTQAQESNSGAGFVIGAVIGAAIGFGAAGPAGLAPGAAIGGAAGNLAETVVNLDDGGGEEGGVEEGGGEGGGGEGDGGGGDGE